MQGCLLNDLILHGKMKNLEGKSFAFREILNNCGFQLVWHPSAFD